MATKLQLSVPTPTPHVETVLIPPKSSESDIRSLLLSAAEVADESLPIRLRREDGSSCDVKDAGGEKGVLKLEIGGGGVATSDVEDLKNSIAALKTQLAALTMGVTQASRTPKKAVRRVSKIDPRYLSQPKYTFTPETREYLKTPQFDNWQWEENEMLALMEFMFSELNLVEEFNIDVPVLKRFLQAIKDNYNNNPFHNFRHSFCVTQMLYGILHTTKVVEKLKPVDKLILLISAIGHDLDHPGFNNAYQINARTDLAIIYNDQSPLENHHCAVLFTLLRETNVLANLPDAAYREFRKGVIKCILATDMAKHGELMASFKKAAYNFSFDDPEHKSLLLQMIMKCADISNEVRPADVAEPWVDCLLEEFFAQSDREKREGLPWAPFMDREKVTKANAQVGFIQFVMIPLFELVSKVLPNMEEPIMKPVRQALNYYKELQEEEKVKGTAAKR